MVRHILTSLLAIALASPAFAAIKTSVVEYEYDGTKLKGYLAYDDAKSGKRPAIMVVHEWWGLNDYAKERATKLAEMGYVAFAADMYGDGKTTEHPEDAGKMATAVRMNVKSWLGRANAGLDVLRKNEFVDSGKIAVIGYCFGGSTALQVGLSGADVKAVVSFHGALPAATAEQAKSSKAKILVCHGADDKFISEKSIESFQIAMKDGGAKFQFEAYPGAVHSFTVKDIEKKGVPGLAYNQDADKKSWASMKALFDEVFK
jgi:dienelactone hydrolase